MKYTQLHTINNQRGSVLIVGLMILVVLTMIGVSSMSSTSLQEQMAGNFRDRQIAFQAAETTLAYAEEFARNSINSASIFNNNCNGGYCSQFNGPTNLNAFNASWWSSSSTKSIELPVSIPLPQVRTRPRYIIEFRGNIGATEGTSVNLGGYGESAGGGLISNFRVTVHANGLSDNTQVILQSNYGKRL